MSKTLMDPYGPGPYVWAFSDLIMGFFPKNAKERPYKTVFFIFFQFVLSARSIN